MNKTKTTLKLIWNKGIAIALLAILIYQWANVSDMPFGELLYAIILVGTTIVTAPIIRLLVFPAAAEIAEGGKLKALLTISKVEPALMHYWICTILSYAVTALAVTSIL